MLAAKAVHMAAIIVQTTVQTRPLARTLNPCASPMNPEPAASLNHDGQWMVSRMRKASQSFTYTQVRRNKAPAISRAMGPPNVAAASAMLWIPRYFIRNAYIM